MSKSFWITNVSSKSVSLEDLKFTIPAKSSMNLLNKKCKFTEEQLIQSAETGSLFKKRHVIFIRKVSPITADNKQFVENENFIPSRSKSIIETEEKIYEELNISDEEFAENNADLA